MILLAIGLVLAYTNEHHVLDDINIMGIFATGIVELMFELMFAVYFLDKAIGVI